MLLELSQYFPYVFSMVLWVGRIDEDIIKENQDEFVQVLTKESVHHIHELGRGVGDAKTYNQEFIKPPPRLKRSFCEHLLVLPGIYQYPDRRSILLNTLVLPSWSNRSLGNGSGYLFLTVFLFSQW